MADCQKTYVFSGYPSNVKLQCYSWMTLEEVLADLERFPDSKCVYYEEYREIWKSKVREAIANGLQPCLRLNCKDGCPDDYQGS